MTKHPKIVEAERQKDLEDRMAEYQIQKDIEQSDKAVGLNAPNTTLKDVYEVTEKYLHINDKLRIDLILATALSNQLDGTPIWLFIVGSSGDWKSVFTRSLEGMPNVIKVDQLTKNTLATGMKKAYDLGRDLQNSSNVILFPDLASMTSMNVDDKSSIWGQFRNLYDGFILKQTGGGVKKAYENCHVTMIGCTTQAIRDEILIHAQLGTRELMYDTEADVVDDDLKMDKAWDNEQYEYEMQMAIKKVVCDFLTTHQIKNVKIPKKIKTFLKEEAKRLKILRATGMTDRRHRELLNPISPEVPTRLIKQFKRIYISLKSLDNNYSDKKIKKIISRIVDSSGNKVRRLILDVLKKNKEKTFKISEVHQATRIGRSAVKSQLEMLWNMNVITKQLIQERIGGYVKTDEYGKEMGLIGGRIEEVGYYQYRE